MNEFTQESDKKHLVFETWWAKVHDPTQKLTSAQIWWIAKSTLLASVLIFFVNFSIGCLLFIGAGDVEFFKFPDPNCLMLALTLMTAVDQKLWWSVGCHLMCGDVIFGNVAPLKGESLFYWPKEGSKWYWYVDFTSFRIKPRVEKSFCGKMCDSTLRNLPYELLSNFFLLPIFAGFSYLIYGQRNYGDEFQPEVRFVVVIIAMPMIYL